MNFNEYELEAMRLRIDSAWIDGYAEYGLVGEVGELASLKAKGIRDGYPHDYGVKVKKELGDILWFITAIAVDHNFDLEEIAQENLRKLNSREIRGVLQGSGDDR